MRLKVGQLVLLKKDTSYLYGNIPDMGDFSACGGKVVKVSWVSDWDNGECRIVAPSYMNGEGSSNMISEDMLLPIGILKREGKWKLIANIKTKIDRWSRKLT